MNRIYLFLLVLPAFYRSTAHQNSLDGISLVELSDIDDEWEGIISRR